ncbi:MAG: tetratricopeptide repeat protein [Chitinophagaceae bacterium]
MIENKVIPESTDVEFGSKAIFFWEYYGKKILIGLGIAVVLAGAYLAYRHYVVEPDEAKASEAMFRAQEYFGQDSVRLALNGDNVNLGFVKLNDRYSGTKSGKLAGYYAGACYLKMGDYANAVKYLKDFSTDSKQIQARAYCLLGDALSEQGKKPEAAELYSKAGKYFDKDDYNSPEYLFRAGYLYESIGKNKEAIEMYKLIKQKYSRSERGFEIDKYLARLGVTDTEKN